VTQIAPYLRSIDERRCYSNYGPLACQLQAELSRHIGCPENTLITVSSATAGLTAALLALDLPANSFCLMPSWTFAATPHATLAAGLTPWFHDVDSHTWALNPQAVSETFQRNKCPARAVIVVAPFGTPLDFTAWQHFQEKTGVPVIVDAAAAFDTVRASSLISVVSLHATKILAAGEGGFVITPNPHMRDRVMGCSNFGFEGSRIAQRRAINAKMSEYHAAVALASLECWPEMRLSHLQITDWYRQSIDRLPGVCLQPMSDQGWAGSTTNMLFESHLAEDVAHHLLREGIETRMWWGYGCQAQPAFAACPHDELSTTEQIAPRVLGLPHFPDMKKSDVWQVAGALSRALKIRHER
jgi:dTDP-4-amino-4,6-dideoxygalactose transaminase